MIPKIIHQTWKTSDVPTHLRPYQESWTRLHPEWEYRLWTDEDNRDLVERSYPQLLSFYESLRYPILKVEFAKLLYLDKFGGLYVDLDFEALRPLDAVLGDDQIVLGQEIGGLGGMTRGREYIMNAIMASPAGHPFWREVLDTALARFRRKRFWEIHEIYVIDRVIDVIDALALEYRDRGEAITIHPHEMFYPSPQSERSREARCVIGLKKNSYAVHHYDDSWFSPWAKAFTSIRYAGKRFRQSIRLRRTVDG